MSWTLGKAFGIPVRLHFTMLLLPFIAFNWLPVSGFIGAVTWLALVILLFGSVLLHELGHALVARRYGVRTHDIVLTPIGGMARVLDMPRNPKQEIAIAIAGPAVSLTLAAVSLALALALKLIPILPEVVHEGLGLLLGINLMLGIFNLVPALPMDGGRILRGYLAMKRDHLSATRIAAKIGRVLAILGGVYALFWAESWSLALISLFIYIAAGSEIRMAAMRAFQERTAAGVYPPENDDPSGDVRTWSWTWHTGTPPSAEGWRNPAGSAQRSISQDPDWSPPPRSVKRDVVVITGKAEIVNREDPEDQD